MQDKNLSRQWNCLHFDFQLGCLAVSLGAIVRLVLGRATVTKSTYSLHTPVPANKLRHDLAMPTDVYRRLFSFTHEYVATTFQQSNIALQPIGGRTPGEAPRFYRCGLASVTDCQF